MNILIYDNEKSALTSLVSFCKSQGDSVFLFSDKKTNLDDIDVAYFLYPNKELLKECLNKSIPVVSEYVKADSKKEKKSLFKCFYKYVNAIHYLNNDDQYDFEATLGRRTNGHIFDDDNSKLRNMLFEYSGEENHNQNKKNYYSDELNDDFAFNKIEVKKSNKPFKYVHNRILWRFGEFLAYYVIAKPLIFGLNKCTFHQRIRNKYLLKRCKHKGYFIYCNHTQGMADAFTPNLLSAKRNYIVVSRETVSIPGLKGIVTMLGAIPVYSDIKEVDSFEQCIEKRIRQGRSVAIYPEAHIWPYYTKIRPFKKDSFRYPVDLKAPVYVITNTWQKRRFGKKAKLVSYLSGPIYPDETMSRSEAMEDLKEKVYFEMIKVTRSVKQVEAVQYIKIKK